MEESTQEGKLDQALFDRWFKADIRLGEKPPDQCTDEEIAKLAIPKVWSMALEKEFQAKLWMREFIGTRPYSGVVRKDELIKKPGDEIFINKLALLKGEGDLGTTHRLESNEERLDIDRVSFVQKRKGIATCWPFILSGKVSFSMKSESKDLIGIWAAQKVDKMLLAAAQRATEVIYSGTAQDIFSIQATDTLSANDIKRAHAILSDKDVPGVDGSAASGYVMLTSAFAAMDLKNDPEYLVAVNYLGVKNPQFQGKVATWMGVDIRETSLVKGKPTEASPSVMYYESVVFGARALGLAWGHPFRFLEKVSSYQEDLGIGVDFWLDVGILRPESLVVIRHSVTPPR